MGYAREVALGASSSVVVVFVLWVVTQPRYWLRPYLDCHVIIISLVFVSADITVDT